MFRLKHIHDNRINYDPFIKGKPAYRGKNVELRIAIDRTEEPYGSDKGDMIELADKIWTIFIQESNYIKFDMYAPSTLSGSFSGVEKSEHEDDSFWITLNYADYGSDMRSVNIIKSFNDTFEIQDANKLYTENEDAFWTEVRMQIRNAINTHLTGRPGRIKKVKT